MALWTCAFEQRRMSATSFTVRMLDVFSIISSELYGAR
jgi:hypothetical protein